MLWIRRLTRIVVGLLLLWGAWHFHLTALELVKEAISPPWGETAKSPGQWFGEDPDEFVKRPENQAKLDRAIEIDGIAFWTAVVGLTLGLSGLLPIACWALFGEWRGVLTKLRKRQEKPVMETKEPGPEAPAQS